MHQLRNISKLKIDWKGKLLNDIHTHKYICPHKYTYIYMHIHIHVYVCMYYKMTLSKLNTSLCMCTHTHEHTNITDCSRESKFFNQCDKEQGYE